MPDPPARYIRIQAAAPAKPAWGAPCNGCGVCCLAEPCPVGRRISGGGGCEALLWDAPAQRYRCGAVLQPQAYWWWARWLPAALQPWLQRWLARRIAANIGCDSDAVVE